MDLVQNCVYMRLTHSKISFHSVTFHPHVTDLPLMQWISLLLQDQNFGRASSVLLPGYKQAVRNCPWVVEFWTGYVRAQERLGIEHEETVGTLVGCDVAALAFSLSWALFF